MDDEFAGALAACATIDAVKALFKQRIAVHGYTASACGAFLPTDMGPETHFFFQDWPPDWIELYVRRNFLAADYTVAFRPGYEPKDMSVEEWFGGLLAFYEQPEVVVTKKTKRGQAELDIKPLIYDLRLTQGEDGNTALFMKISTGSSSNLKPELVLDAYYGHLGQERTAFAFLIQREEVYADLGDTDQKEKGNHTFIPLEELGQEIL